MKTKQIYLKIGLMKWMMEILYFCIDNALRNKVRNALNIRGICGMKNKLNPVDLEKEYDDFESFEREMLEKQCLAEDFLGKRTIFCTGKRSICISKNISDSVFSVCLPRYEVRNFHGDVIHSCTDISYSTKLSNFGFYLCRFALTATGDLCITAANNSVAIEILKNRFGVTESHKNVVGSVKPLAVKLKHLHDQLNLHVRPLVPLGKNCLRCNN
ncbi:hypothetical protein T08_359, partial [Trichinella sp. T8]